MSLLDLSFILGGRHLLRKKILKQPLLGWCQGRIWSEVMFTGANNWKLNLHFMKMNTNVFFTLFFIYYCINSWSKLLKRQIYDTEIKWNILIFSTFRHKLCPFSALQPNESKNPLCEMRTPWGLSEDLHECSSSLAPSTPALALSLPGPPPRPLPGLTVRSKCHLWKDVLTLLLYPPSVAKSSLGAFAHLSFCLVGTCGYMELTGGSFWLVLSF